MKVIRDICEELDNQSKVLVVVAILATVIEWSFLFNFIPYLNIK